MNKTTQQVRLYPTPEQGRLLMAHCQEYISTINVLTRAFESGVASGKISTKDFHAMLPSAVKNQALRDAQSVLKCSFELGCLPVLKKPICQWNNQNWRIKEGTLLLPMCIEGKTQQVALACAPVELVGKPGILRIKKKRGKWIADIALSLDDPTPSEETGVMGVDLGIKVQARDLRTRQRRTLLWQWQADQSQTPSILCPTQETTKGKESTRCEEKPGQRAPLDEEYQPSTLSADREPCA